MELVYTVTTELQTQTLDQLQVQIVQYDAGFRNAFGRQMGYAYLAGAALNEAKALCPHGQFGEWVAAKLPTISKTSRCRYMEFAEAIESKFPTVGNLKTTRLLTSGDLTPEQTQTIVSAVHDAADGKSLTEFYRDLGVIRQPKPKEHHEPKPQSPEEEAQAQIRAADELGNRLAGELTVLASDGDPTASRMSDSVRRRLADACIVAGRWIRTVAKTEKPVPSKRKLSPEARARIIAAQKARWARAKAGQTSDQA